MPRLADEHKQQLIKNAKAVYFGYLKLEWLQNMEVTIGNQKITIANYLKENKGVNPLDVDIKLDENHSFKMQKGADGVVKFTAIGQRKNTPIPIKDLKKYSSSDVIQLLTENNFNVAPNEQGEMCFSTTIKDIPASADKDSTEYTIGGSAKISLYNLHISNLGRIIKHFEDKSFWRRSKSDDNMLVSLTTGSGKTFTQALWMMVLKMSGIRGVFTVPEKLLNQFKGDLGRLIPDNMDIEANGDIIIDSPEEILTGAKHAELRGENPVQQVDDNRPADNRPTIFAFDEAHLLASNEKLFVKAKTLASKFINLYLTATPTPALVDLAQGDDQKQNLTVVATMNNKQKVDNGYAERTSSYAKSAQSLEEMGKKASLGTMEKIGRRIADTIDPQTGYDAANAFGEAYLYNISKKEFFSAQNAIQLKKLPDNLSPDQKLRLAVRWSLQPSAFQPKTLICANHFEDIVNLNLFLEQLNPTEKLQVEKINEDELEEDQTVPTTKVLKEKKSETPTLSKRYYTNGNSFDRDKTYKFLQMAETTEDKGVKTVTHVDTAIYDQYASTLNTQFTSQLQVEIIHLANDLNIKPDKLPELAKTIATEIAGGVAKSPITNSMHGIIELTLSILAAKAAGKDPHLNSLMQDFGSAYLDKQRFNNLEVFTKELQKAAGHTAQNSEWLKTLLTYHPKNNPKGLDEQVANELAEIIYDIIQKINKTPSQDLTDVVDNWFANQNNFDQLDVNWQRVEIFAANHYKQFAFAEVERNETIEKDVPFTDMDENKMGAGIANREEGYKEKQRPEGKRAVEVLDPKATVSDFTPNTNSSKKKKEDIQQQEDTKTRIEKTDNLFRLGIATVYATDKKIEGFNDPNLHQVAVLAHSDENTLSNPANLIQAYGRNRGLNRFRVPNFFLVTQRGVKCVFGVNELNKPDYQSDYDKSLKKFKINYIRKLGQDLGEEILAWIEENKDALHEVDDDKLAQAVIEKCFDKLDNLNKANAFKFKLTQKDYEQVLGVAIGYLAKKQDDLQKGTTLSWVIKATAMLMHCVARIVSWWTSKEPRKKLQEFAAVATSMLDTEPSADVERALVHYKINNLELWTVWKHNLSRQIIFMNVANEARSLHKIRDKYYSAILLKPLNILDKQNRKKIKNEYPELQIILEGLCSYIALADPEEKETLASAIANAVQSKDQTEIKKLVEMLKTLEMNPSHPDQIFHTKRIQKMLVTLGYEQAEIENYGVEKLTKFIQSNEDLEDRIYEKIDSNREGLIYLKPSKNQTLDYANYIKLQIINDIKKLVEPLITDPAFKEMLKFISDNFTKEDLKVIFCVTKDAEPFHEQLLEFIDDINKNGNQPSFYEKYFLPPRKRKETLESYNKNLLSADLNIYDLNILKMHNLLEILFTRIDESNLQFYKLNAQGEPQDPKPEDRNFFKTTDDGPAGKALIRQAVDGYDIKIAKNIYSIPKEKVEPLTVYLQLSEEVSPRIIGIMQTDANKNYKFLTTDLLQSNDIILWSKNFIEKGKLKDAYQLLTEETPTQGIKNLMTYEEQKVLDNIITSSTIVSISNYNIKLVSDIDNIEEQEENTIYLQLNSTESGIYAIKRVDVGNKVFTASTITNEALLDSNFIEFGRLLTNRIKRNNKKNGDNLNHLLHYTDLVILDETTTSEKDQKSRPKGVSIFSPALHDQNDEKGKVWRRIFGLKSLQESLPTIDRVTRATQGREMAKAVETSTKLLQGIKDRKVIRTSDTLSTYASLFSKVLKREERQPQQPCDKALGGEDSRIKKMKACFDREKETYFSGQISEEVETRIITQIKSYIFARANVYIDVNSNNRHKNEKGAGTFELKDKFLDPKRFPRQKTGITQLIYVPKKRLSVLFNNDLTHEKLQLAEKFIRKLAKTKNNYHKVLKLIDDTIAENDQLMIKHKKNPNSANDLYFALFNMKEALMYSAPTPIPQQSAVLQ
ncbi:DEAD/DEAH box helicase family protein [Legionella gresilensis]|uniref:DEAD/DEAH box helicase family protein n=1 Tax=Legionella gresilensis TaxID=91823 RepID=UPI00104128D9|nr:DEAD/DEAH box helicase family protein [Legionella gresilensis]